MGNPMCMPLPKWHRARARHRALIVKVQSMVWALSRYHAWHVIGQGNTHVGVYLDTPFLTV